jgi:hypothetical protein
VDGYLEDGPANYRRLEMLLVLAILLLLLFGGLGFVAHILWIGLILAVIVGIAAMLTGRRV